MIRVLESLFVVGAVLSCVLFFTSGNLVGTGSDFGGFEGEILELHVQVTNLQSARAHEIMTMATLKRNQAHLTTKLGELRKDLAVAQREADDWVKSGTVFAMRPGMSLSRSDTPIYCSVAGLRRM